jgi:hypothetical protein
MSALDDPRARVVFGEIATRMRDIVTAEIHARISTIPMLAHYTSLEAMRSIFVSKQLWFSRVDSMNDTSEIKEGGDIVGLALAEHGPTVLKTIPFAKMAVSFQYKNVIPKIVQDTYALSLCEHGSDEQTDRLVMWRAYGHDGHGLCLVLRKDTLLHQKANGLFPVAWSPIEYDSAAQLSAKVARRLERVEEVFATTKNLSLIDAPILGGFVASCVMSLVIGHKNSAFRDEKEIRFIQSGTLRPLPDPKGGGRKVVGPKGSTRNVFALPLRMYPEFPIDASLPSLLDHIIIGPSDQQEDIHRETRAILDADGLSHVDIRLSEIPYRSTR